MGESELDAEKISTISIKRMAEDLLELAEHLELPKFYLGGTHHVFVFC